MTTRFKISLWLLLPLLATTLLLSLLQNIESMHRAPGVTATGTEGAVAPPTADPADLAEADVLTLSFVSDRRLRLEAPAPGQATLPDVDATIGIRAVVELRVHAEREWGLVIREIQASGTAQGRPAAAEVDLAAAMRGEILLRLDENHRIKEVFCPEKTTVAGRKIWMHIVDCLQYTRRAGEVEYDAHERDDTGTYLARYRRVSAAGSAVTELVRTKVRYVHVEASGASAEISGETRMTLDPLPVCLEGEHTVRALLGAAQQRVSAQIRFRIERMARERRSVPRPAVGVSVASEELPETAAEARDAASVLEDSVRKYAALRDAGRGRTREAQRAFHEIVHSVRRSPAAVAAAERHFAVAPGVLAAALAAADSAASGAVIQRVLADRARPLRERHAALMAASDLTRPSMALERTLRRLRGAVPEFANSAQLALASVGANVRSDEPLRFAQIEDDVLQDLRQAQTLQELTTALEAVGNLGPRILPNRVRRSLVDRDPVIRSAAAHALATCSRRCCATTPTRGCAAPPWRRLR